jgi:hypothetical protein
MASSVMPRHRLTRGQEEIEELKEMLDEYEGYQCRNEVKDVPTNTETAPAPVAPSHNALEEDTGSNTPLATVITGHESASKGNTSPDSNSEFIINYTTELSVRGREIAQGYP